MAWYEDVEETRLLVSSSDPSATREDMGQLLQLRHPKTGESTCYLLINGCLQEINWFKQSYGSWFMGDYISEDGRLYAATPVDPVFILLPIFDKARMKNGSDPGKFRQLDEIIYHNDYPGYHHLSSIAEKSMEVVCDFKEVGSIKFFRLNDSKVLTWMYCKVQQLKETLLKLDKNYAAQSQKDTLIDAVMILGEYLQDDPWLKLLSNNLKLNIDEAVKVEGPKTEILSSSAPTSQSSFKPKQEQIGMEKRVTRNGKQNKKIKIETNSHNIKDMFSRAPRRGK
ncbi:hypothetical protein LXL04_003245 [Taraxacum kok-saghyz]